MKFCCSIVLIFFGAISGFCQSKYDFPTGFDSLAYAHKIKSKSTYLVYVDSLSTDTSSLRIHFYDSTGFLTKIEVHDLLNLRRNPHPRSFLYLNTAEFQYNESGYLINEDVSWSGPVGWWGKDTIRKRKIEDWAYVNHSELLLYSETINNYPEEEEWIEKCEYFYHPDNRLDSVVCIISRGEEKTRNITTHLYNEKGLLIEIESKNDFCNTRRTLVRYEFFD